MNLTEFHFIRPYWLLALLPAIGLLYLLLKNKLNRGNWSAVVDKELLPFILQKKPTKKNRGALFASGFSSLLAIFALADPTWERLPSPVFKNDAALVIALDLSRSMDASDIKPSRLAMARYKIADILKQRKDGQTALLVYAGDAFTVTPLTTDVETIANQLEALTTEIMPAQGSDTPLALSIASQLLKNAGLLSGEILLLTDGADFDKTKSKIESIADKYRVSIIGIGTPEGAPIKTVGSGFLKDDKGNIVLPKLNRHELSQLANSGNGVYQSISKNNSDIDAILSQIQSPNRNQSSAVNDLLIDQWNEKGPWLLLLILPLVALQFRKGLLCLALLCLLPFPKTSYALEWNDLWKTKNQQAQKAFTKKDYKQAANKFQSPQWKAAAQYEAKQYDKAIDTLKNDSSASGQYNLGNALAQSGKLSEALDAYKKSLQTDPNNEDAKYNKKQVEKALEEQKKKQKQDDKKKDSEDKDKDKDKKKDKESNKDKQEQKDGDSKPSEEKDKSEQNQSKDKDDSSEKENQSKQDQKPAEEPDSEKPDNEKEAQKESSEAKEEDAKEQETNKKETPQPAEYDETKQAKEQWLKRIPDNPAGLLKRKFKYQYGQRGQKNNNRQAW